MNQEDKIMAILSLVGDTTLRMDIFDVELKRVVSVDSMHVSIQSFFDKKLMEVIESNRVETGLNDGFSIQMADASKFVVLTTLGKSLLDYLTSKYLVEKITEVFENAGHSYNP